MNETLNTKEVSQMKSVAGSAQWITRQCRPELGYRVSRIQSTAQPTGQVKDIKEANKVVDYAKATSSRGLVFKSGMIDWYDMVLGLISDASFAGEVEIRQTTNTERKALQDAGEEPVMPKEECYRSQGGRIIALMNSSIINGNETNFHPIGYSSTLIKRVCRATVQAEAYTLQQSVEEGDRCPKWSTGQPCAR